MAAHDVGLAGMQKRAHLRVSPCRSCYAVRRRDGLPPRVSSSARWGDGGFTASFFYAGSSPPSGVGGQGENYSACWHCHQHAGSRHAAGHQGLFRTAGAPQPCTAAATVAASCQQQQQQEHSVPCRCQGGRLGSQVRRALLAPLRAPHGHMHASGPCAASMWHGTASCRARVAPVHGAVLAVPACPTTCPTT